MPAAVLPILAATAAVGTGFSIYQGVKQNQAQKAAQRQAQANADKQAAQAEQQMNKANATKANASAMQSANEQAAKGGIGGTMLTGSSGIDPNSLNLGKSTLLGQ